MKLDDLSRSGVGKVMHKERSLVKPQSLQGFLYNIVKINTAIMNAILSSSGGPQTLVLFQ